MEHSKNKSRYGAIAALIIVLTSAIALTTCRPMLLQDIAGYVPVYSQVVGPEGGTVTDSRGASVEIPAGALAEATTITIATYENPSGIYSRHGVTPFTGGADFGPDGIEFLKPVTITLPTERKMVPGQTQPLFMQNPDTGAWEMTGFTLTAAADSYSATAEVTHFTPYVSSLLPPDALSKIEEFFDGTNGQVALGSYMAWFLTATDLYGYTTECGDSVYEVVGLFFDFTWQAGGVPGTAVSEYGDVSLDTVAQLNYSYDYTSTDGPEYIYNMLVTVYFDVTENPPEAEANISILEPVPGSTVEGIETISTYIVTGDSDTDIDSVAFYADGGLLGSDTEAPFQWYWDTDGLADGEHTLTAVAAFSGGESVESEAVTVVVGDGGDTVAAPVFDPAPGEIMPWSEISITTTTEGASIYYTTDGTTPACGTGTLYTEPITLSADATLKAIACKDGYPASPITSGNYTVRMPKIVFHSERDGDNHKEIFIMNADGTEITQLTDTTVDNTYPSICIDESKIVFWATGAVMIIDGDGSNRNGLISGGIASISANGGSIVLPKYDSDTSYEQIHVMNTDGTNLTRLTEFPGPKSVPSFSRDETTIVFAAEHYSDHFDNTELYQMSADGTNLLRLTNDSSFDYWPSLSPDNSKIVFYTSRDGNPEIYLMNADGSGQTNLTNHSSYDVYPSFSPDGEKIVFQSDRTGSDQIYIMNTDGTDVTQLTFSGENGGPRFSP